MSGDSESKSGVDQSMAPDLPDAGDGSGVDIEEFNRMKRQLERNSQELKKVLDNERTYSDSLRLAHAQAQRFARDLQRSLKAEKERSRDLEAAYQDSVLRLIRASQVRDLETGEHLERIGRYVKLIAARLGIAPEESGRIAAAAAVHDLGKVGVPDRVLRKPGPLDEEEWSIMRRHTEIGASILEDSPSPVLRLGRDIALTHHERWDGSGYPNGLAGEEIPLTGRMVMLADNYDALRSRRPYKRAFSHAETCGIILQGDGRSLPAHFDPELLALFEQENHEFDAIWRAHPEDIVEDPLN